MGGPVYIHFSDNEGTPTSGENSLSVSLPENWSHLYPGMNINFEASCVLEGHEFTQTRPSGDTFVQYTTGAVLRAKILLEVTPPPESGVDGEDAAAALYSTIWSQLQARALNDIKTDPNNGNKMGWVFDVYESTTVMEENYFYFVYKDTPQQTENYTLIEVGGHPFDEQVDFLDSANITLPPVDLTNIHADCDIKFTIVFQAVQAFFPYEQEEVGKEPFQGDTTGRDPNVTTGDVGLGKPLTIKNSRKIFKESIEWLHDDTNR